MTDTNLHLPQLTYFKRFRMERDIQDPLPIVRPLPIDYYWLPWHEALLDLYADVKVQCFVDEIDAMVFPSLATREGCRRLMLEISGRSGFQPGATWLIGYDDQFVATVQGVRDRNGFGAIQNLGVVPTHRGRGLGAALLLQALHGFRRAGCHKAVLEVTSQNAAAVRLYRRHGFRAHKTIYKTVDTFAALPPAHDWLI